MILGDCGSSWLKILDGKKMECSILSTQEMFKKQKTYFDLSTGHSGKVKSKKHENELVALAKGALTLVKEENFTVVDTGSRDVKFIRFKNRRIDKMDWNVACGSSTGATIEMLCNYYNLKSEKLNTHQQWMNVTCGVFGMERILEMVSQGHPAEIGISMFIHGLARNVYKFTKKPDKLYLSGGFCSNPAFVKSLEKYCNVILLGRMVLVHGLLSIWEELIGAHEIKSLRDLLSEY